MVAPPPLPDAVSPARLLVVDDEPSTRAYLHAVLSPHYVVELVSDAASALDAVRRGPLPELILSDVVMAGVDGLELLRILRADPATALLPILLITSDDAVETRMNGFEQGADDYIHKPVRARELLARVRTHLDLARLRRRETDHRRTVATDRTLHTGGEHFRAIVNQATAGVAEVDPSGRFTLVNRTYCDLHGYTEEELLGRGFADLTHPEDLPRCRAAFERVLATGQPIASDKRHVRKDGRVIWLNDSVSVIHHGDPAAPVRAVIVAIDITERKRVEEALRRSEEHFRLVVESTRDYVIFTIDAQGFVATWNKSGVRLKGYRSDEIIGRHVSIFCTPEDAGTVPALMSAALAHGCAETHAWRVRKDGTRFWAEELLFPMRGNDGELLGFVAVCRDLSERKSADDERARLLAAEQSARREAETANAAKDQLLAAVSHELRTPLAPVRMAVFLLRREAGALSAAARESLEMLQRNVELEIRLIDDLLDISRAVHGKLELDFAPVNLHDCVRRAVEVCQGELDAKAQTLAVDLGAAADGVRGDAVRLQQVFWNLLRNAIKFSSAGSRIDLRSRNEADGGGARRIVVEVLDAGIGIDPAAVPRLFQAFEQLSPEITRTYGGLGLGLSISHAIIQSHGGSLRVTSDGPEHGATFVVEMPLA